MVEQQWGGPLAPADVDDAVALTAARFPGRPEPMPRFAFIDPAVHELHSRTVRVGAELVAYARLVRRDGMPPLNRWVMVVVAAGHEDRGLGGRLAREMFEHVDPEAKAYVSLVDDEDERSRDVAEHLGFEVYEHGIALSFGLTELPRPREVDGVEFEWSPDLDPPDTDALHAMLDLAETNPERATGLFLDAATLRSFVGPGEQPVGWIARVDGEPIALAHGSVHGEDFGITYLCVHPDHRGRGVALGLKERLHASAAELGARRLFTTNEAANAAIRGLNERLGYERVFGELRLRRAV
jgi:GNAT superfamily N-acetyltransferase